MKVEQMRKFVKENLKEVLATAILLFATGMLILGNEIRDHVYPVVWKELTLKYCDMEKDVCEYTGQTIETGIEKLIFEDTDRKRIIVQPDQIRVIGYINNKEIGQVDIEISIDGYRETFVVEDAFSIQLGKGKTPTVCNSSRELIELTWEGVTGADGYLLYKSKDNGETFTKLTEIKKKEVLSYQDTDIGTNEMYLYYVCAYQNHKTGKYYGNPSQMLKQYTPLDTPSIASIHNAAYNTLRVEWPIVDGAAGYQIYRSEKTDGIYTLLQEIADGNSTSYSDGQCECGKEYFYYITACQKIDEEVFYGTPSAVVSGKTTPGKTSLRGSITDNETAVTLTWKKVSGAQGYEVYKNNTRVARFENADTLTWSESGLAKETEASYKVRAYCLAGNETVYGPYSGSFVKRYVVVTNYSSVVSGNLSSVTQYQGVPYIGGGTSTRGWDCSGFTQWVMKNYFCVSIPKAASAQGNGGTSISVSDRASWKPGDILCYTYRGGGSTIRHVALYLGNGKMMHALNEKYDTIIQDVDYYERWDPKTSLRSVKRYH